MTAFPALLLLALCASSAAARTCRAEQQSTPPPPPHQQGDDTAALQRVLDDPSCSEVLLPAGSAFAASVLWVRRSDVTLTIEANATLAGLPAAFRAARPDCATEAGLEFNWTNWCALLRVTAAANFTLRGGGTLAPGGVGGAAPDFYSALHVRSTAAVSLSGVRVHCTAWWWCAVLHNATDVHVHGGLHVDGSAGRDGLDCVNCRRVLIEDAAIEGSDDALCFKSIKNGGLEHFPSRDVLVRRCTISSTWDNAVQFGSATEVDMANFTFEDVVLGPTARKAAVSLISMDGANISGVAFRNVTVGGADVATPLFVKLGNRAACEDGKGTCGRPGSITDVSFSGVRAEGWGNVTRAKPGHSRAYTVTIEGLNGSFPVGPGICFDGLRLVAPGGGAAADAARDPPISPLQYQPRYDGVRPSFGLFVRHARGVALRDAVIGAAAPDGRPAIVLDDVQGMTLDGVSVVGGAAGACQLAARNSSGNWTDDGVRSCAWEPEPPMMFQS